MTWHILPFALGFEAKYKIDTPAKTSEIDTMQRSIEIRASDLFIYFH